jgi:hypothetical protein
MLHATPGKRHQANRGHQMQCSMHAHACLCCCMHSVPLMIRHHRSLCHNSHTCQLQDKLFAVHVARSCCDFPCSCCRCLRLTSFSQQGSRLCSTVAVASNSDTFILLLTLLQVLAFDVILANGTRRTFTNETDPFLMRVSICNRVPATVDALLHPRTPAMAEAPSMCQSCKLLRLQSASFPVYALFTC